MFLIHQYAKSSEQIIAVSAEEAAMFISTKKIVEWHYDTLHSELHLTRDGDTLIITTEFDPAPGTQEYFDLHGTHASEDHWEPEYAIAISHRGVALCQSIDDPILIIKF